VRLIFASTGGYGHVIPLVPLAVAARGAGHDVAFATEHSFRSALSEVDLDPIPAGITVRDAIGTAAREAGASSRAAQAFGSVLPRRVIDDLEPVLADRKPDLVVYEVLNPGAGIAASRAGIPAVCHGIGRVSGGADWTAMCATWIAVAEEFGIDVPSVNPQYFGNLYLDICPPSLQQPGILAMANRAPLRPVAWNEPAKLPPFVKKRNINRPLVYVTLGTALGSPGVLREVIDGLSQLPVDVIVSTGRMGCSGIGDVPAHVVIEEWVPQADLLPYVGLVVSHGGSGTTLGALAHGLPHLVIPQGADQFSNAQAVSDAGLGRWVPPAELTPQAVCHHARALLDDEVTLDRAKETVREIAAMPSPHETIERLAGMAG
jgi:UDP:flavonoid glycosyltransferase YjiC (YdhE family)